jgi:Glycosyltransferase family 87
VACRAAQVHAWPGGGTCPLLSVVDQVRGRLRARAGAGSSTHDGRVVVLGCTALYLSLITGLRALWHVDVWPWLGVPSRPSLFVDARNVAAAVECSRLGHDPLVDNPCDPWGRAMFYPRVWLLLRWTGLDQRHTLLFGALIGALFVVLVIALLPRLSVPEGALVAAAVCSPAVMFAIERGNMDLLVFCGLALAAVIWRRGSATAQYAAVGLVLLTAVAKLYPAVALLAFLPVRRRRTAVAAGAALLVFAGYLVATRDDAETISRTATQGQYYSYGARILLGRLYHGVVGDEWGGSRTLAQGLVLVAVMLVGVGLWLVVRRRSRGTTISPEDGHMPETSDLIAFRMGALVYLGTFVLGNSFDYRLIFLLLLLPLLLRWPTASDSKQAPRLPRVALGVVVVMLWIGALSEPLRLWDELVSWSLAGILVVLLTRTVRSSTVAPNPEWPAPPTEPSVTRHLGGKAHGDASSLAS